MLELVTLFLSSLFGCVRRGHDSSDSLPRSSESNTTLNPEPKPEVIPAVTYEEGSSEAEKCSICLIDFESDDIVRILPNCKHTFHKDCIDQWLPVRSSHCPNCRDRTIESDPESERRPGNRCARNRNSRLINPSELLILNFGNSVTNMPSYI